MSFLKKIFERKKDHKYGKGHRLGNASESAPQRRPETATTPISLQSNNEAALKAAEAAMQRLSKSTTPRPRSSKSAVPNEMSEEEKELEKALELKEHYFGKPV